MTITVLVAGSRGDAKPYLTLPEKPLETTQITLIIEQYIGSY